MQATRLVLVFSLCLMLYGCNRSTPQNTVKLEPTIAPEPPEIPEPTVAPEEKVDAAMTLDEALTGKNIPENIQKNLELVDVDYLGFDGLEHRGQIVLHRELTDEVREIFDEVKAAQFPIEKMIPITRYDWSDDNSMADNNSSGFNYRRAVGRRRLSQHASGRAIDINPRQNPYVSKTKTLPAGANYDPEQVGTLTENCIVVRAFEKRGWVWGGNWRKLKDWQHFEKPE